MKHADFWHSSLLWFLLNLEVTDLMCLPSEAPATEFSVAKTRTSVFVP